jgi:hypothetical protein
LEVGVEVDDVVCEGHFHVANVGNSLFSSNWLQNQVFYLQDYFVFFRKPPNPGQLSTVTARDLVKACGRQVKFKMR